MVKKMLRNIDFISPEITLFYEGNKNYPTAIGGIFTIIIFLVGIISFIYQLISYLNYKVNEVQYYRKYIEDIGIYEFNHNKESMFININYLDYAINRVNINLNKINLIATMDILQRLNENSFTGIDH